MDWIGLASDRDRWWIIVKAVMKLRVPQYAGNFLTSWEAVRFSGKALLYGLRPRSHVPVFDRPAADRTDVRTTWNFDNISGYNRPAADRTDVRTTWNFDNISGYNRPNDQEQSNKYITFHCRSLAVHWCLLGHRVLGRRKVDLRGWIAFVQ